MSGTAKNKGLLLEVDHHLLLGNALDLEQVVIRNKFSEFCKVATKQYITYSSS